MNRTTTLVFALGLGAGILVTRTFGIANAAPTEQTLYDLEKRQTRALEDIAGQLRNIRQDLK